MYDTSSPSPFKGEIRQLWPEDIGTKAFAESLLGLDPALEETLDLSEFETNTNPVGSPPGVPDRTAVSPPVNTSDLLTLTPAVTTQYLAQLEGQSPIFTADHGVAINHPQQQHPAPSLPQLAVAADDVVQTFPDDVLMPEFQSLVAMTTAPPTSTCQQGGAEWAQTPFYSTVKTEDLTNLTACSVEASLPGFTSTTTTSICKSEPFAQDDLSCSQFTDLTDLSPSPRSTRSMSESSTATSVMSDTPRRIGKGGSRRRQVPKGSEEYKEKRARNNVAVRKSRAKAKEKQRMTESRVKELTDSNEALQKRVEMLTKELTVLKGLFINVDAKLPEGLAKLLEQSS